VNDSELLRRLERETLVVVMVTTAGAFLLKPTVPLLALGVIGGGVLIGLAYWGIRGLADVLVAGAIRGEIRSNSRGWALVKFFTRHAILALAGYGMMTRLKLDPVGMLMGVSAPVAAVAFEAFRSWRGARR
jgi:hypothetical protein